MPNSLVESFSLVVELLDEWKIYGQDRLRIIRRAGELKRQRILAVEAFNQALNELFTEKSYAQKDKA